MGGKGRWTPSPVSVALLGVALALVGNLATNLIEVHRAWWRPAVFIALGLLILGVLALEAVRQRTERVRGQAQAWQEAFGDGPEPRQYGSAAASSLVAWLAPWASPVVFTMTNRSIHIGRVCTWCLDGQPGRVRLLIGGPGSGKTRLAMKISDELRSRSFDGWSIGWARPGHEHAAADVALNLGDPVLIVVDDADSRDTDDLRGLLTALHAGPDPSHVKVLLIARDFGGWWIQLQQPLRYAIDLALPHAILGPIANSAAAQIVAVRSAAERYAVALGVDSTRVLRCRVTGVTVNTPAVLLHATALEIASRASRGGVDEAVDVTESVTALFAHERQVWVDHARSIHLDVDQKITPDLLRDVLVLTLLVGARDADELHRLLPLIPGLEHADAALCDHLNLWLHLYPRQTGFWARPYLPAFFVEHLMADAIAGRPDFAAAIALSSTTEHQAEASLTTLAWACTHAPRGTEALTTLLHADAKRLLPIAIRIAVSGLTVTDVAIATTIDGIPPDEEFDTSLSAQMPFTDNHAHLRLIPHTCAANARARIRSVPAGPRQAQAYLDLGAALRITGQLTEANDAADAAVTILLATAKRDVTSGRQLAVAHRDRAVARRMVGWYEEALADADTARDVITELLAHDPPAAALLANVQRTRAETLCRVGRYDDAVNAACQAISTFEDLAEHDPVNQRPFLAEAQRYLARALQAAGQYADAEKAALLAVHTFSDLAATNPLAYLLPLAESQLSVAAAITELSREKQPARRDEAMRAAESATRTVKIIAGFDPAVAPFTVYAWEQLAKAAIVAQQFGAAVIAATEAVTIARSDTTGSSPARQQLGSALRTLSASLRMDNRFKQAVTEAQHAVALFRALDCDRPSVYRQNLAEALRALAVALLAADDPKNASQAAAETVGIYTELTNNNADPIRTALEDAQRVLAAALHATSGTAH